MRRERRRASRRVISFGLPAIRRVRTSASDASFCANVRTTLKSAEPEMVPMERVAGVSVHHPKIAAAGRYYGCKVRGANRSTRSQTVMPSTPSRSSNPSWRPRQPIHAPACHRPSRHLRLGPPREERFLSACAPRYVRPGQRRCRPYVAWVGLGKRRWLSSMPTVTDMSITWCGGCPRKNQR